MNPVLSDLTEDQNALRFRLSGINVSLANALRRIILSEIPTVVFRTTPHADSRANIEINTTRMNNELLKQRLSCIPIHIADTDFPIQDHFVEIGRKNDGDTIDYVTSRDFQIKNTATDSYLTEAARRQIFPPDPTTGDYIDFARLRPRLSEDIGGEELKMTCGLDIGTAKEDSAFNVASTCSYAAAPDPVRINAEWTVRSKAMKAEGVAADEIENAHRDWLLLEAKRFTLPDTFDYIIETVGAFSNMAIVEKAADVMFNKIKNFSEGVQTKEGLIKPSETTIVNSYDITLEGEDYTLGKVLEYFLYSKYYDTTSAASDKSLSFCGFRKPHPHIDSSYIRIGLKDPSGDATTIRDKFVTVCAEAMTIYQKLASEFSST
jgi:DNA-directed RNA polymerase subunit L